MRELSSLIAVVFLTWSGSGLAAQAGADGMDWWGASFAAATDSLAAGEVGYVATGAKDVRDVRVVDTITRRARPCAEACPGYALAKPMVFSGLYPTNNDDYDDLLDALQKLQLNDAAIRSDPDVSDALGLGFRLGFLGLLHMEIVRERLEREFDLDLLATTPNVRYEVELVTGEVLSIDLLSVKIRTFDNAVIFLPNAYVASIDVRNWSRRKLGRRIKFTLGLEYGSDMQQVKKTVDDIREAGEQMVGFSPAMAEAERQVKAYRSKTAR